MMLPTRQEWLFSIKTFAAAMLALGIGLACGLDRPYWAMASAYIASQPLAGATRSKAVYRFAGTFVGAGAALVMVPNLADAPALLSMALAGWTGLCLTLSLLDRTPRAYIFMLAGYTTPIIGFPSVGTPDLIWDVAVARTEEIGLGIVCASLVASLVFPNHVGPVIAERIGGWLKDSRRWALDVLEGRETPENAAQNRRRLAADAIALDELAGHLAYDASTEQHALGAARVLQGRMLMLLPLLSSLSDRIAALRALGGLDTGLSKALADVARWMKGEAEEPEDGPSAAVAALESDLSPTSTWTDIMRVGLLARLRELIDLRTDCLALQAHIDAGKPGLPRLAGVHDADVASRHRDIGMAALSGVSASLTIGLICAFWIATAWPEGAVAAEMAAVACSFFAVRDNPVPAIIGFLGWTALAVVIDAVLLFAVLPQVNGFEMLALALAPPFLLFGVLTARPATAAAGMALAANGATLLSLQETYNADFATFANAAVATVLGMAVAAVLTHVLRSIGWDAASLRLLRANWLMLARAAERRGKGDRAAFAGLMLDRLGLVASRLAEARTKGAVPAADILAELRVGLNILDLRRARHMLPPPVTAALDAVLDGVAAMFRGRIAAPHGPQPPQSLLPRLDNALALATTLPPGPVQQETLLGLGGLRRALFPDAAGYVPVPANGVLIKELVA